MRSAWPAGPRVQEGVGRLALSLAEFDRLVAEHGPALYRMAYRLLGDRHEAEDAVQDTYRSAWKSRGLFESGRGERAWLASILRRRVVDRWRRHHEATLPAGDASDEVGQAAEDPLRDQYTDEMQRSLARLPDELRETLLLVVVAELTHQEAAQVLGVPLGTVLSRVSRARKRLRELLIAAGSRK
jgi:RNA polymerase sigma-70 factor, ECF subfamily